MATLNDLISHTNEFYKLHFPKDLEVPSWSAEWKFKGELHNNTASGVYAILEGERVIYIGMADSEGQAGYEKHSLGHRLSRIWRIKKDGERILEQRDYTQAPGWETATGLVTLPVTDRTKGDEDLSYMVYSLEVYLIRKLNPIRNIRSKRIPESIPTEE